MPEPADPSFVRLFLESRQALSRYVRSLVKTRSAADEIVQEAFLRTYRQWNAAAPMRPYLFSIARNLAFKARRHDRVVVASSVKSGGFPELQATSESPEDSALTDERMRLLHDAIENLPPQCRAAFTRRMLQGQSYKEIAAQLGISPKTVEKHIALGVCEVHATVVRRYREVQKP